MRSDVDHGFKKFSDLRCRMTEVDGSTGLTWPDMWFWPFTCVSISQSRLVGSRAGPGQGHGSILYLELDMVGLAMVPGTPSRHDYPGTAPRVHHMLAVRSLGANHGVAGG